MSPARIRRLVARHCAWWCLCGIVLAAFQPFLAVHFRTDGWEDEPGFRVRSASETTLFEPDERANHPRDLETTLFVPSAASIDLPHAFEHGLAGLMALVLLLLPLTLALRRWAEACRRAVPDPVPPAGGAPPPSVLWRRPPETAPPRAT